MTKFRPIEGWEPFVERLLRTERCEVYITGSSAKLLSKEIATQMRGRALAWEMFPFSFRELLDLRGFADPLVFSTKQRKGAKSLVQVCETLKDPQTEKREIAALAEAMSELGIKSSCVVTRSEEKQITVDAGTISVVPVWRFLLLGAAE